jgi:hypothetical protein
MLAARSDAFNALTALSSFKYLLTGRDDNERIQLHPRKPPCQWGRDAFTCGPECEVMVHDIERRSIKGGRHAPGGVSELKREAPLGVLVLEVLEPRGHTLEVWQGSNQM